jgi:hypothetical protein
VGGMILHVTWKTSFRYLTMSVFCHWKTTIIYGRAAHWMRHLLDTPLICL